MHSKIKHVIHGQKYRITCICAIILISYTPSLGAQNDTQYISIVENIINAFKTKDKNIIALFISFPIQRHFPVPSIKNKEEFVKRFDEVFDNAFIDTIIHSNVKEDWQTVSWRGIMFLNGLLWVRYDGKISAVNYQTEYEKKQQEEISTVKYIAWSAYTVAHPILEFKTKHHRIRIEDIGHNEYRYMSWNLYKALNNKPELIIQNGKRVFKGSGANHHYLFTKDDYTYECSVFAMGNKKISSSEVFLTILKGDEILSTEKALTITYP